MHFISIKYHNHPAVFQLTKLDFFPLKWSYGLLSTTCAPGFQLLSSAIWHTPGIAQVRTKGSPICGRLPGSDATIYICTAPQAHWNGFAMTSRKQQPSCLSLTSIKSTRTEADRIKRCFGSLNKSTRPVLIFLKSMLQNHSDEPKQTLKYLPQLGLAPSLLIIPWDTRYCMMTCCSVCNTIKQHVTVA